MAMNRRKLIIPIAVVLVVVGNGTGIGGMWIVWQIGTWMTRGEEVQNGE